MSRKPVSKDVQLSKTLTYLLRHGAVKEGIPITNDGYVKIEDILNYKAFKGVTKDEIIKIVNNCPKQRFSLKSDNDSTDSASNSDPIWIKATQGHSMKDIEIDLKEITDPNELKDCIHGTYFENWNSILRSGLSKMNRQHIHFSEDYPDSGKVLSGMRRNCQIAIHIDVNKAMKDGIKFYRSENNVILTSGDENGYLNPKYFLKAVDIKTGKHLDL